jgi:cell division protein FtsZ
MIEFESESLGAMPIAKIKVLGVGGGGTNMVNNMIDAGYESIDFIVANTDAQSLKSSKAPHKIQLGVKSTKGLGAGANPDLGRRAAEEDIDRIIESVQDADIVFLTGGLGGGTGSGALPVIVRALAEHDILTVAVLTKPFTFEGKRRAKIAQDALDLIKQDVDTVIVIPNQKLIDVADQKVTLMSAFSMINNILNQFVKSIADIISRPGHINVDFADIKTIMKQKGFAVIGTGRAIGEDRAMQAALKAISSPLLDNLKITGARGVLLNISGSSNLGLHEVSAAASIIYEQAHEEANIILGSVIDEALGGEVSVTVIATGFFEQAVEQKQIVKQIETNIQEVYPAPDIKVMEEKISFAVEKKTVPAQEVVLSSLPVSEDKKTIDLTDLDIPAVMRRVAQEKQL